MIWWIVICVIVFIVFIVFWIIASKMFTLAISRQGGHFSESQQKDTGGDLYAPYAKEMQEAQDWMKSCQKEEVQITSKDGLQLFADYVHSPTPPKRIVICCHGFHGSAKADFACQAPWLLKQGCDVLLIDHRAHGRSQGQYITYGAKESQDILGWCNYLCETRGGNLPIYLMGVSMGAASVVTASGLDLPKRVIGIVADCPFASFGHQIQYMAKNILHIPLYPTKWFLNMQCKHKAHFAIEEANALEAVKQNTRPILLIHGCKDTFVPTNDSKEIFDACPSEKKRVTFPEAIHACSYYSDSALYESSVLSFFQTCEQ